MTPRLRDSKTPRLRDSKTAGFLRPHCPAIPGRDLSTKNTKPSMEKRPESLEDMHMLEF